MTELIDASDAKRRMKPQYEHVVLEEIAAGARMGTGRHRKVSFGTRVVGIASGSSGEGSHGPGWVDQVKAGRPRDDQRPVATRTSDVEGAGDASPLLPGGAGRLSRRGGQHDQRQHRQQRRSRAHQDPNGISTPMLKNS